jgi:hypothetical protein
MRPETVRPSQRDLFCLLAHAGFQLAQPLALTWWAALQGSTHPKAQAVARAFTRYRGTPNNFVWWVFHEVSPGALIDATEGLVEEQALTRGEAVQIERGIDTMMKSKREWR